ncbi:hypothetical protein VTO42DRAFT_6121 [Malbranchea cinnamomea]
MQFHDIDDTLVPIAVIGIGCRLPGGANTPEKLWRLLAEGRDGWTDVPEDRFNWKSFNHPDAETQGAYNHRGGHFLDQDITAFDGGFFDIPGFECEAVDPQQRIQLEVAYEALENAGISLDRIRGSNTSVYVAIFSQDYAQMQFKDMDDLPKYHMTGIGNAIVSNRISYIFDLKGPSVSLDTGCSGGLVSLHQACQTLRTRECDMALAGGVNLMLNPDLMIPMSLMHILNKDGRCYSFDARGSGYGRGEGAAMVVLKRLDDAIRDGDNIRAVIRNTGVNHDGKTTGITLPNRDSQQSLIRAVYERAGLDPRDTAYIEAHGTGTAVGDVEEMEAIQAVFKQCGITQDAPIYVGSIKPNIGHLESASGLAGFIKAILMIEKGQIPPNLNLQTFKETLNLDGSRVKIPSRLEEWPKGKLRRISVNSFGYGGTNGHAIVEAMTSNKILNGLSISNGMNGHTRFNGNSFSETSQVLALTAKNEKSLKESIRRLREWASARIEKCGDDDKNILNLAHTLTARRSTLQWRYSFTAASLQDLVSTLSEAEKSKPIRSSTNNHVVFVFTGQGAQWFAMGKELMKTQSRYGDSMRKSDEILRVLGASWSLIEELSKDAEQSRVNEAAIAQPATTAIQIALVDLLHSVGVEPYAVFGHSSGEIGAAYAAGAIDHAVALKVAYHRGQLNVKEAAATPGAMLAVDLGDEEASKYTEKLTRGVAVVACSNSPSSSTISGDEDAVEELRQILEARAIFVRRLKVDTAYHSHHVRAVADQYLRALDGLESGLTRSSVKFYSSVTGEKMTAGFGPKYWVGNLISKVRFRDALENLCSDLHASSQSTLIQSSPIFVELGPHGALAGPIRQTMQSTPLASNYSIFSALSRNQNALSTVLDLAGKLFERGCTIDLPSVNLLVDPSHTRKLLHDLPPYPWDHSTTYWHESRLSRLHRFRPFPYHDLLGVRLVSSSTIQPVWRHLFTPASLPWLREHTIDGMIIFPAAAYMCMAIEAVRQTLPDITKYTLKDVSFISALVIPEKPKQPIEIQLTLRSAEKAGPEWKEFNIISINTDGASAEHCRGLISTEVGTSPAKDEAFREVSYEVAAQLDRLKRLQATCNEEIDCTSLYEELKSKGNYYGPNFARVKELKFDGEVDAIGNVVIPDVADCMPGNFIQPHVIHPTTLDALLHAPIPLFGKKRAGQSVMAIGIGELVIFSKITSTPHTALTTATTLSRVGLRSAAAEISVFQQNSSGDKPECVIHITEAELFATRRAGDQEAEWRDISYQMQWGIDSDHLTSSFFTLNEPEDELAQAEKVEHLNQAAAIYMRNCVEKLAGLNPAILKGHFQWFFSWMLRFQESAENKRLLAGVPSDTTALLEAARKRGVEGEMMCRVGEKLYDILTEKVDSLALMLEDGLLYRLYADDASTRCYKHMIRYMQHATFKNPNMTILELGAGTGGATAPLLEALGSNGVLPIKRYDFTDVSSGFFERSGERLKEWSAYLEFKRLDIQSDLLEQGFEEESYDLIIASNVLHVAEYIDLSLSRVRKLLKPGGRLLLIETTRVLPFYNTLLGSLPGWWGGVNDGRTNAPLLSVEQWDAALRRTGYDGLEIAANDFVGGGQRSAMLISKAIVEDLKPSRPVKLLLNPRYADHRLPAYVLQLKRALQNADLDVSTESLASNSINVSEDAVYIVLDDGVKPILTTNSQTLFGHVKKLLGAPTNVLWVTGQDEASAALNPEKGLIFGAARVVRGENQALRLITFDIQESTAGENCDHIAQKIKDVVKAGFYEPDATRSTELEFIYKGGQLYVPRLIPDEKLNQRLRAAAGEMRLEMQPFHQFDRPLRLEIHNSGILEHMKFVDDETPKQALTDCEIEVQVETCGVNFKDVIIALGQVKKPLPMAGEYAGTVVRVAPGMEHRFQVGDRVCGYGTGTYASHLKVNGYTACRIPESMSFIDAAAVAVAFSTAHLSLIDIAKLEKGQSVLIHAAAGGVGQAALRIAKHVGAEIFATVGSDAKRQLLMEEFGIPEDHIFSSSTSVFKKGIERLTNGRGVDVVLNSLSGQPLQDSWSCIASFGTFVEIGKTDVHAKMPLNMWPFNRHVTFASVDLGLMCEVHPKKVAKLLDDVFSKFETGEYTPMKPITVLPLTNIEDAFRMVQTRKHVGKIVLEANSTTMVKAVSKPSSDELTLSGNATYMIAGGLGGLGREIARFMAARGAKHIVLLSRHGLHGEQLVKLQEDFKRLGTEVVAFACDLTDAQRVQEMITTCARTLPPIKGVIQASMVLKDRVLAQMTLDEFRGALEPKVTGTQNLVKALEGQSLDFFLMLSSGASIIGNLSQANYAAGNAYMDTLANITESISGTRFISLNLGPITDVGAMKDSDRRKQILVRQGYVLTLGRDLLAMFEHSLSAESATKGCKQFILGFDYRSLRESDNWYSLENPMFSHLLKSKDNHETKHQDGAAMQSIEESITAAGTIEQVGTIVADAIARKISTLVAVAYEEIDFQRSVVDFGLDSLVLIELKNWIAQKFKATLQVSEISDAAHIIALAMKVASRSAFVAKSSSSNRTGENKETQTDGEKSELTTDGIEAPAGPLARPKQPLPDLDDTLDQYLEAIRPTLSDREYAELHIYVEEFRRSGGIGQTLQGRLEKLANDPQVDNWQAELYARHTFLRDRVPLIPRWNFFLTHLMSPFPHTAAQRAAIISSAAFRFKLELDAGELGTHSVNEAAVGMEHYSWFFNATREPRLDEDKMVKYPGNDYLVAFRRGNVYKVPLREGDHPASYDSLLGAFEAIVNGEQKAESWVGVLTADGRDSWAEIRQLLGEVSSDNKAWIQAIEASAFVVYLDEARPGSASERGHQFLHANGFNRWADKTMQFAICDNGVSATIIEHAMIDGMVIRQLNDFVTEAIVNHKPNEAVKKPSALTIEQYTFKTTPIITQHIQRVRKQVIDAVSKYEPASFDFTSVSNEYFRSHKCIAKSGVQMALQLAMRRLFGYNPVAFEPVSLNHFLKGRVERTHVVLSEVADFCAAASSKKGKFAAANPDMRRLFFDGVKAHANSVMRASRGYGVDRHMLCLEWSLREGEDVPALFASPLYAKSRAGLVLTDSWPTGALECGAIHDEGSFWIHFEVKDDRVRFSVWGPTGQTQKFRKLLEQSVDDVRAILEA